MKHSIRLISLLLAAFAGACSGDTPAAQTEPNAAAPSHQKISAFGRYEGYSDAYAYDGYERHSVYVPMRDGVRLAVDYFLPTKNGVVATEKLPVVFRMTPYNRATVTEDGVKHMLSDGGGHEKPFQALSRRGYIMAEADVRGQGASFGGSQGQNSREEARDGADLVAWFATQPWSSGKVGMFGTSYLAQTQYLTASEKPPALKALFPTHSYFDFFTSGVLGGLLDETQLRYNEMLDELAGRGDAKPVVAPVDGPDGARLLAEALEERIRLDNSRAQELRIMAKLQAGAPIARDIIPELTASTETGTQYLSRLVPYINEANIPIYHWGSWNDVSPDSTLFWYANHTGPKKLVMGPATHSVSDGEVDDPRAADEHRIRAIEAGRWFDYWLKGIDNGVLEGAPIHYALQTGGHYSERHVDSGHKLGSWTWQAAESWAVSDIEQQLFALSDGAAGSIQSRNDGALVRGKAPSTGSDALDVDVTVTTGLSTRFADASLPIAGLNYPDMRANDAKSLTYTTPPLEDDLVVVGTPSVALYATSTAPDGALFAWLEEVDEDGYSTLVTFGQLKASHRTLGEPYYENFGAPWPSHRTSDVLAAEPFNTGVFKIEFPFYPTATRFLTGNRLRLTIAGANADSYEIVEPDATITVHYGGDYPSALTLPVLPAGE